MALGVVVADNAAYAASINEIGLCVEEMFARCIELRATHRCSAAQSKSAQEAKASPKAEYHLCARVIRHISPVYDLMNDDNDDEAELLAALSAFSVTGEGSVSDSDDDGVSAVDTSAVAQLLAGRRSSDVGDFGALAEALQSIAVGENADAWAGGDSLELQVGHPCIVANCGRWLATNACLQNMRAMRVAALETSLSDCKLLTSSVVLTSDHSVAPPAHDASGAVSESALQRLQVQQPPACIASLAIASFAPHLIC